MSYSTNYALVYSANRRDIINSDELDDPKGYEVAAIMEKYKDGKLISRDQVINPTAWVSMSEENAYDRAIERRKSM